jgi:DNA-binding GntR family transcriptional regulator
MAEILVNKKNQPLRSPRPALRRAPSALKATTAAAPVQTMPERIAEVLSQRIINGHYGSGERLVEVMLSKEFGVSHGPVRAALRLLESFGLVTIHAYRGAEVTRLTVQEVRDVYNVRAAMVSLRAKWIAQDPDRMVIVGQVRKLVDRLLGLGDDEMESFLKISFEVNRLLTDSLHNRWLRSTLQAITMQTSRYSRLALKDPARRHESARLWRMLVDVMAAGDADLAENVAVTLSLTTRDAAVHALQSEE